MSEFYSEDFYDYDLKHNSNRLYRGALRTIFYLRVLKEFPFGNDPKSRLVRKECEAWIAYDEARRDILLDQVMEALRARIYYCQQRVSERKP